MDISILCVFLSFILIYLSKIPVGIAMNQEKVGYNNSNPRGQQATLEGWGARAVAAHQNSFESFMGFAPAMIFAHISQVDTQLMANLGVAFVISRLIYHGLYLMDWHSTRSTVWSVGWGIIVWLFVKSL